MAKVYVPLPPMTLPRSSSSHVPSVACDAVARFEMSPGLFRQVIPVSVHEAPARYTLMPVLLGSVTHNRSRTSVAGPVRPETLNLRQDRSAPRNARRFDLLP